MLNRSTSFNSLDDLLKATYELIINSGHKLSGKRGQILEITNYTTTLSNPRVRTSRSLDRKLVKSKFAEFAWYLSKDSSIEYIKPYISQYELEEQENEMILGAYGPKIFGESNGRKSQFERVVEQLQNRPLSKQAYIAISEKEDYRYRKEKHSSPPCTIGLHFYIRDSKLNLTAYMRSNDAYYGLPHDLFSFTMLQELIACRIDTEIGHYTHSVTSMHLYAKHLDRVRSYIHEGFHESIEMPKMIAHNNDTLDLVAKEYNLKMEDLFYDELDSYWKDYVLFSEKHSPNINEKDFWNNRFLNKNMKLIAKNTFTN